jgi:hypothetical protein
MLSGVVQMAWTGPGDSGNQGYGQQGYSGGPSYPGQQGYPGQQVPPGGYQGYQGGPGYQGYGGQQGYPGGPGFARPGDPYRLGKPSYWLTFVITFFFGLFGLIPAILHSNTARERGYSQSSYWIAFAVGLGLEIVLSIALFAILVISAQHAINNLPNNFPSGGPTGFSTSGF